MAKKDQESKPTKPSKPDITGELGTLKNNYIPTSTAERTNISDSQRGGDREKPKE